jgi:hypothetical protein
MNRMRTLINHNIYTTLFAVVLLSCGFIGITGCNNSDDDEEIVASGLVVDGWINSDGAPIVIVTKSLAISGDINKEIKLNNLLVQWAKVTISDGDSTYILTGSPDKNYFPPYIYRSYDLKGTPGKSYTVKVEYKGVTASAKCQMPSQPTIDDIIVTPIQDNDTLRQMHMLITPDATSEHNYYHLEARIHGEHFRYLPTLLGAVATEGDNQVKVPVYAPKSSMDIEPYTPHFVVGDTVDIRLCHITEAAWQFWSAYDNAVSFSSNVFITTNNNMPSNINGGFGIWSAQGITTKTIVIQ